MSPKRHESFSQRAASQRESFGGGADNRMDAFHQRRLPFPLNCPELEIAPPVWEGELLPWSFCCDKAKNTYGNKQVMMQNTTSTIQARVNKRKTVAGR
jgi:hypothetical protein